MRVAILARSGSTTQRRFVLKSGQIAKFGRTDWADFPFPDDAALSDVHFAIHCGVDCAQLQSLTQEHPTLVNESPVTKVNLKNRDIIRAGNSIFKIEIEGADGADPANPGIDSTTNIASDPHEQADETYLLAQHIGLSEQALQLARNCELRNRFAAVLVDNQLLDQALRWHAHVLPKPACVQWACHCVETQMKSDGELAQQSAFKAAVQWSGDPTDENRKEAARWAEAVQYEGIGGSLAAAAGWSDGSLAPDDLPIVSPDDRLTGRAVVVAFTIATSACSPPDLAKRRLEFLSRIPKTIAIKNTN